MMIQAATIPKKQKNKKNVEVEMFSPNLGGQKKGLVFVYLSLKAVTQLRIAQRSRVTTFFFVN